MWRKYGRYRISMVWVSSRVSLDRVFGKFFLRSWYISINLDGRKDVVVGVFGVRFFW